MQLIACHIDNFGKLSQLDLNFHEGVNVLSGPNGWGKSTLAAFFKAMLYGFDNKREEGSFEKERKIYEPWQGGTYGGTLDFSVGEKRYRILRTFGATERGDRFQLIDLDTNLESTDFSPSVGTELFDLDRNSFKKTIYIAQNDCAGGTTDNINAKLGNLAANANDINNYENAMRLLRDKLNHMSPTRATGSIRRRRNTITELEQEVRGLEAAESASDRLQAKLTQKEGMLREMSALRLEYSKALQAASEDSRRLEAQKTYEALQEDAREKNAALDTYRRIFPHGVPTEESFARCQSAINQLEEQQTTVRNRKLDEAEKAELAELARFFGENPPEEEMLDAMLGKAQHLAKADNQLSHLETTLAQLENKALQQKSLFHIPESLQRSELFPIGIVLFAIGLLNFLGLVLEHLLFNSESGDLLFKATMAAGFVFLIAGTVLMNLGAKKNHSAEAEQARKKEESERLEREMDGPIREIREEIDRLADSLKPTEEELKQFLGSYPLLKSTASYQEKLYELREKKRDYRYLTEKSKSCEDAAEQCRQLMRRLNHFAELLDITYGEDMQLQLNQLQNRAAECYMAKNAAETAMRRKRRFEAEHDMKALAAPTSCPYSLEELNGMIKKADEGMEHLRASVAQYRRQIDDLQEQLDMRDEKEQELYRERTVQEEEEKVYEVCSQARDFLQAARDRFVGRYMGPVTEAFRRYYTILTGDASDNWMLDTNMTLRLKEQGQLRETRWLSAGYQDLLGICMRVSIAAAMYPQEKPFLILDDPFVNLDNEKLENGKKFLAAVAEEYQTIYFTCHESRE